MKTSLSLEDLRVESFPTQEAEAPAREQIARTPYCSAIDLCPTRPC
ncbi:hypothetical protein [Longimicrobium sp.]|nr:hypothetical protein [Longimicrobium sp.]HEX6039292.1 hypothetical protein [Longimicrobium sp.]